jgi:hypothetical protein
MLSRRAAIKLDQDLGADDVPSYQLVIANLRTSSTLALSSRSCLQLLIGQPIQNSASVLKRNLAQHHNNHSESFSSGGLALSDILLPSRNLPSCF